ncbi:uncharacterized protein KY384_003220 [Bacidia gigantensis]|uniref:uncharacterized protein n=1 Tax=Bacidia gigantensis TaxID=2732470 RepID=UPI001D04CD2D|nr:uncharacterized protein KY384_003220 [Bacidia gigantensis]KAG8531590.1 hypothetical protein KY384_003220 [Bacidia gigantensis]
MPSLSTASALCRKLFTKLDSFSREAYLHCRYSREKTNATRLPEGLSKLRLFAASDPKRIPPAHTIPTFDSPVSLAGTRYRLAPGSRAATISSTGQKYPPQDHASPQFLSTRRRLIDSESDSLDMGTPETVSSDKSQHQIPNPPNLRDGVGNAIYRFAGVAGKVWQNWSSTFRGFYSGGGQGFDMRAMPYNENEKSSQWDFVMQENYWRNDDEIPATPGKFPQEDYIPNYWSQGLQDQASTPPRKRNKRDPDMTTNWVIVGNTPHSKNASPSRSVSKKVASSPGSTKRASPRSRRPQPPTTQPSFAASPRLRSDRASYASPRSASPVRDSPVSAEVQKHAARIRKKEAEEDARLKVFNQQLKVMIREGKEALGTRFEVEEIDENMAGYSDTFRRGKS